MRLSAENEALPARIVLTALGALPVLGGCAEEPTPPRWIPVATEGRLLSVTHEAGGAASATLVGHATTVASDLDESWLQVTLEPQDWERFPLAGTWRAPLGLSLVGHDQRGASPYRLSTASTEYAASQYWELGAERKVEPNTFFVQGDAVLLALEPEARPTETTTLHVRLRQAQGRERARIHGRRFSGAGVAVWPGERHVFEVEIPPRAALRFATAFEPILDQGGREVLFRVQLDEATIFEHRFTPGVTAEEESYAWHEVALPSAADRGRVAFETEGGPGFASFFAPTIGPLEVGAVGARPWGESRPDLVLFVADTFRADNLAAYGGTHGAAPELDRLLERGLVFRRAWSVSTYTLPGHASMFAGVYPRQAGINSLSRALPEEITTLTEVLAEYGYRTGAITDAGIVSQSFAFDQGFEWFDESHNGLPRTLQRAEDFLACDDGRPVFLFVQSYRTHRPYRPGAEALEGIDPDALMSDARDVEQQIVAMARDQGQDAKAAWSLPGRLRDTEEATELVERLRALYLGGVRDLDQGFTAFHRSLEQRGHLREGLLVLTSDHGESFAEHGRLFHGNEVFESETRVPLVLFGERVTPGTSDLPASLIDLCPTFAAAAGVPARAEWLGADLLSLEHERVLFAFECDRGDRSTLAIMEGDRKLVGLERDGAFGEVIGAYDLDQDPQESRRLDGAGDAWPEEMLQRLGPRAAELTRPIYEPSQAELDPAKAAELNALGYGGDG